MTVITGPRLDEVCGWPECVLEPYHDGEHLTRARLPREPITWTQFVNTGGDFWARCELNGPRCCKLAVGLFVDRDKNGWLLCYECSMDYKDMPR